ncbi:MAG: MOSC domain-containing protein [Verrucomicrobia bacterium]|nr:MOSC domain-containing protein [Verrucomicrobiota bacterium]
MHLAALFLHPVKSMRACSVVEAGVDALGLVGDRRFMVVDPSGRFLTQRAVPRLALVGTALSDGKLSLSAADAGALDVATASDPSAPVCKVSIWKSEGLLAEDCGDDAAGWLSEVLATRCRLVRIGAAFRRAVRQSSVLPASAPEPLVSFADAFPFLVVGEASLADLNDRLASVGHDPVPMDRFRPNLTIAGSAPYEEDRWVRFRIGDVGFRAAGPCARCTVITTDQATGDRGPEPLRLLATYRRGAGHSTEVHFGQNLVHENTVGTLRIGDPVTVLEAKP